MTIPEDGGVATIDEYARLQVQIPRALSKPDCDYDAVMASFGLDRHRWSAAQSYWGGRMNADENLVMQFAEAKTRYMKKR
jgi:hypothetical protein